MSTENQKKVAQLIVDNTKLDHPLNGGEILEKVRYSKGMQIQPSRVLQSVGVQEELIRLGFTEFDAKKVTANIMNNEDEQSLIRLKAADMTFKVHGTYSEKENFNQVNILILPHEAIDKYGLSQRTE